MSLAIYLVMGACAVAVATDLAYRKIPNPLTFGLALVALALHAPQGAVAFALALGIFCAVLVIGCVAFSFKWLGGGDVKLLAAGAAALGFPDVVPFLIYTAIGGGVLALTVSVATGRLRPVLHSVVLILRPFAYKGTVAVAPPSNLTLPYACAIAFGALAVALSHTAAPFLRLPL